MDQVSFNALTRTLCHLPSRREVLRGLASAGLGLGVLWLPEIAEAKKKRKNKKGKKEPKKTSQTQNPPGDTPPLEMPPLVFNQYGCVEVGQPCRGDNTNCCSGICQGAAPAEGQPDDSRCIAHGAGTCSQQGPGVCLSQNPNLLTCNNENCVCWRTTAGSNFCGERFGSALSKESECRRDADCDALGFPPGTACAPVSEGYCSGITTTGMACMIPCGTTHPGQ